MKKLLSFLILFPAVVFGQEESSLTTKVKSILGFTAPTIYTEELKELDGVLILDAREKKEFEVSHLPEAVFVGDGKIDLSLLDSASKSDTIVVYCTIGYRSEKVAEQLIAAGFENTYNLFGGIFAWKNGSQQVVDNTGKTTDKVHCYSKSWSLFLQKGEKVY